MSKKDLQIVRAMNGVPDMDLENRILRNVVVATEQLASDGMIIIASGISLVDFLANPTVTAKHGYAMTAESTTIARALKITQANRMLVSEVQFAETDLGKEYAYLYGLNEKKEVFMRAWSIEGPVVESESWDFKRAKEYLGKDWNEEQAALISRWSTTIQAATKMVMKTFSAVEVGADRGALTRAYSDGVKVAGELVARMDLGNAEKQIADLRSQLEAMKRSMETEFLRMELAVLTKQTLALGSDGAAAAARGDTAELLQELHALRTAVKHSHNSKG